LAPRDELCLLGDCSSLRSYQGVNNIYQLFRRTKGRTEGLYPLRDKVHPWDPTSSLGVKFSLRGQIKNWSQDCTLETLALRDWPWRFCWRNEFNMKSFAVIKENGFLVNIDHFLRPLFLRSERFLGFQKSQYVLGSML
jgi:hypothetical protein